MDASLKYFKADFIEDNESKDQSKYNLVENCDGLLNIKENVYDVIQKELNFSIYSNFNENKVMGIYNNYFEQKSFQDMITKIKLTNQKNNIIYYFSLDNNVDKSIEELVLKEIPNAVVKPIPSKIYEIYKKISDDLKREY